MKAQDVKSSKAGPADMGSDAKEVVAATATVSESAVFMSITWPHLQFSSFALLLPFGWPEFVKQIASYVVSIFSLDLGCVSISASPMVYPEHTKQLAMCACVFAGS